MRLSRRRLLAHARAVEHRLLVVTVLLAALLPAGTASATRNEIFRHRYPQVWSAAVRLVRVDYGLSLREQNVDIGYLLYDWRDSTGRTHLGSMELVETRQNQRPVVRVVVRIAAMPSYIEQMILDRLERKLRAEFGEPAEVPDAEPEPASQPADDADDPDQAEDSGERDE